MKAVNFVTIDLLDSEGRLIREWANDTFINDVLINDISANSEGKVFIDLTPYAFKKDLDSESNRAKLSELKLQSNIDSESNRALREEALLQSEIDSEAVLSAYRDFVLLNKINSESNRAIVEELVLQNEIDSEAFRAKSVEDNLQIQIDSEGILIQKLFDDKLDKVVSSNDIQSTIYLGTDSFSITNDNLSTLVSNSPISAIFDSEGGTSSIELSTYDPVTGYKVVIDTRSKSSEGGIVSASIVEGSVSSKVVVTKDDMYREINNSGTIIKDPYVLKTQLDKKQDLLTMGNNMEWDSEGKVASTVTFDYDPTTGILNIYNH